MRKMVERSLRHSGLDLGQVFEASNGVEALDVLAGNTVDLILCDVSMPVMNGIEFVRQARSLAKMKGVPVVMITTEGSEVPVLEAISAGAQGYIRKPFSVDQVKLQVAPLLEAACKR